MNDRNVIEVLTELISIPSPYPFENPLMEWVEEFLKRNKFKITRIPVEKRFEIVASKGVGTPLLLFGHLDTVPIQGVEDLNPHLPGELEKINQTAKKLGWKSDPYIPTEKNDRIYGNGAIDMKAGVAAILVTAASLDESWFTSNQLKIAFSVDEEYLDKGMVNFLHSGSLRDVEGCICTEISDITGVAETGETPNVGTILLGRRGRVALKVILKGKGAHAAIPEAGKNAIQMAARTITHIMDSAHSGKLPLGEHFLLPKASITPLKISAGTSSLSVPDRCVIEFDRHIVPPETIESVINELRNCIKEILTEEEFNVKEVDRTTPFLLPYVISEDCKIAQTVINTLHKMEIPVTIAGGNSVADENLLSSTDYKPPILHGIPTVDLGCKGGNYHKENEWVEIASLRKLTQVLIRCCNEWGKKEEPLQVDTTELEKSKEENSSKGQIN